MINLGVDPRYEAVRHDPRVIRMLDEMGLPVGVPGR
jgi:hypothetical protein